ncbi:hypothetical protein [Geminisphaera colitermitum]|uniref:hypothetical protein n=1 Tax=Geminisphaera colitermitum TaxID=1148786 RepID=UPI000158C5B2|nr:hypothetical protein [Geminisphaera colitermitum]
MKTPNTPNTHRSPRNTFLAISLAVLLPLFVAQASATIVATDSFSYTANSALNGASGGTGWTAAWTASSAALVADGSAQFGVGSTAAPNGNEIAYRTFDAQSGDELYVSFTISATGHEGNDFFALWLDQASSTGGSTDTHSGLRLNVGMSSGALFARPTTGSTNTIAGSSVADGTNYHIVVRYSKGVGLSVFNTVTFWINPTSSSDTPIGTISSVNGLASISAVGFRGVSNEMTDRYFVNDLVIATTWADVAPIPEPRSVALGAGFVALAVLMLKRALRRR